MLAHTSHPELHLNIRPHKAMAGGPSEVEDCGAGWAKLHLAGEAAAGRPHERPHNPEFLHGEIKPQTTDLKTPVGVEAAVGETPSLTGKLVGETHRVSPTYTNPPTRESAPEGPNLIVGSGGSD